MKPARLTAVLVTLLVLGGCASYRSFEKARDYEQHKQWDQAVEEYLKALEIDPMNKRYLAGLQNAKLEASRVHFARGKAFRAADQPALAALEFELTVKLDSTNQFALVELASAVEEARRREALVEDDSIEARKKRASTMTKAQPPQLDPASDEPISLLFPRETAVKEIYRALGNAFGINILFDQQLKDDKIAIELRDVTAMEAIERVMQAGGHFYKVLDERSIIIIPDNPQARREYEDLVIQTFYLSNGDAEQVTNIVRTMLEARYVYPLKALNAITIRDTADKVRIAQQIIEANDKAKAEVVVAVELLQLDVSKARDIGLQLLGAGGGFSPAGGVIGSDGKPLTTMTLDALRNLTSDNFSFNVPTVAYGFVKSNTDAQLLAKPQLRISEGESATLHIGQRVPLPVSTFTSANPAQGGTYAPVTSYTYNDVGIKIAIEPRVHHNREVTLKLKVEVSNIAGYAPDTNPPQPVIGTRTIESIIRLKDGETNFLAGLIREDDSTTRNMVPFFGDIPLLGRLFARDDKDFARTDLVLTMTPHIIRIANITEDDLAPMWVGTGTNITFRGSSPRVESGANGDPFNAGAQFNPPPPPPTGAVSQPTPIIAVPPIQTPTDIFARPLMQPPAAPTPAPVERNVPRNPQTPTPPPPEDSASLRSPQSGAVTAAAIMGPRIAPQPSTLQLAAGESGDWAILGMDLEGLQTPEIRVRYDPVAVQVIHAFPGDAILIDRALPVIAIDPANGVITLSSGDGLPLRFRAGGQLMALTVRGTGAGESMVVLDPVALVDADGVRVEGLTHGGRVAVR